VVGGIQIVVVEKVIALLRGETDWRDGISIKRSVPSQAADFRPLLPVVEITPNRQKTIVFTIS